MNKAACVIWNKESKLFSPVKVSNTFNHSKSPAIKVRQKLSLSDKREREGIGLIQTIATQVGTDADANVSSGATASGMEVAVTPNAQNGTLATDTYFLSPGVIKPTTEQAYLV